MITGRFRQLANSGLAPGGLRNPKSIDPQPPLAQGSYLTWVSPEPILEKKIQVREGAWIVQRGSVLSLHRLSVSVSLSGCRGRAGSISPGTPTGQPGKADKCLKEHPKQPNARENGKEKPQVAKLSQTNRDDHQGLVLEYVFFTEKIIHKLTYKNVQTHE